MAIKKTKAEKGYTNVPNKFLVDKQLSLQAMGLLTKLYQLPEGWDITTASLMTQTRSGRDAIQSAMKELEKKGYVKKYQERVKGILGRNVIELLGEDPHPPSTEKPSTEKPSTEKPSTEKPQHINTININTIDTNTISSCCSLEEVPTNTADELEDLESTNSTNNEQTIISDLQALNIPTTKFVVETVREWTEEHDVKLLQAVIDKCVSTATNGVNLNYLKKAVDRLTTQNIKSLEDLERAEELRAKQRGSKYGKQQRVEVMPTYEAPTEVEQTLESEHELAMIKFMMGQGPHPETGEMNPSPLS